MLRASPTSQERTSSGETRGWEIRGEIRVGGHDGVDPWPETGNLGENR
jgi:hypothetical protein